MPRLHLAWRRGVSHLYKSHNHSTCDIIPCNSIRPRPCRDVACRVSMPRLHTRHLPMSVHGSCRDVACRVSTPCVSTQCLLSPRHCEGDSPKHSSIPGCFLSGFFGLSCRDVACRVSTPPSHARHLPIPIHSSCRNVTCRVSTSPFPRPASPHDRSRHMHAPSPFRAALMGDGAYPNVVKLSHK